MPLEIKMDRNGLVEEILKQAQDPESNTEYTIQWERPYTIGMIRYPFENKVFTGMGLAKVCWPDPWDKKRGRDIVMMRAARKIADQILNDILDKITLLNEKAFLDGIMPMALEAVDDIADGIEEPLFEEGEE
jgi:hypothetical protein